MAKVETTGELYARMNNTNKKMITAMIA